MSNSWEDAPPVIVERNALGDLVLRCPSCGGTTEADQELFVYRATDSFTRKVLGLGETESDNPPRPRTTLRLSETWEDDFDPFDERLLCRCGAVSLPGDLLVEYG